MKNPKKAKKKTNSGKREKEQYPNLKTGVNLKRRIDHLDMDYIEKLSDSEKEWLNKFCGEYVNDTLDRKNLKKNLHNTKSLKKDCDDKNNSRNRDVYTIEKAKGSLVYCEEVNLNSLTHDPEEFLNRLLDSAKEFDDQFIQTSKALLEKFDGSDDEPGESGKTDSKLGNSKP